VEGAELLALKGVEGHWPRVRRVVVGAFLMSYIDVLTASLPVEVHDVDGRLEGVCELLHRQGFTSVVVEQQCSQVG
jgi:hypothetical protein